MAVALGGAVLMVFTAGSRERSILSFALSYERLFWVALGILVMSGVGNVAAFGATLPGPTSSWGTGLTLKLASVAALALLSVPRTLVVAQLSAADIETAGALIRRLYAATVAGLLLVLAIAMWLAHG
jgi:hypothetical protein